MLPYTSTLPSVFLMAPMMADNKLLWKVEYDDKPFVNPDHKATKR